MSTTPTQLSAKYRGAVVEDLQLPPAVCLSPSTPVLEVLQIAYEREFSQLPVLADPVPPQPRRLVGFVDVERLKAAFAAGKVQDGESIAPNHITRFATRRASSSSSTTDSQRPFEVITPLTPLAELETFFTQLPNVGFALVTDEKRKLVYGVVTRDDLETFVSRRRGSGPAGAPSA